MSVKLCQLLDPERVATAMAPADKWELIDSLVDLLPEDEGVVGGLETIRSAVRAREEQLTTGLERGVALPHAMVDSAGFQPRAALGIIPDGVDFDSFDGVAARFVLLLVLPDDARGRTMHVALLGQAIRLFTDSNLPAALVAAADGAEALASLRAAELNKY